MLPRLNFVNAAVSGVIFVDAYSYPNNALINVDFPALIAPTKAIWNSALEQRFKKLSIFRIMPDVI